MNYQSLNATIKITVRSLLKTSEIGADLTEMGINPLHILIHESWNLKTCQKAASKDYNPEIPAYQKDFLPAAEPGSEAIAGHVSENLLKLFINGFNHVFERNF